MTESDAIAAVLGKYPLVRMHLYLNMQADACRAKGEQIKLTLDAAFRKDAKGQLVMNGEEATALHREFWFWALGTYEFSRTLADQKMQFDPAIQRRIKDNLTFLTLLRVPFAKLRQAGTKGKGAIAEGGYLSISRFQYSPADMFFRVKAGTRDVEYGMRSSIESFEAFLADISSAIRGGAKG